MNLVDKKCGLWAALLLRAGAAHLLPAAGAALAATLVATGAEAQGSGVMTGTVVDAATKRPVPDVVVTVTSPALQGEQFVATDKSGSYRLPNLPPGTYTLRLEGEAYKPLTRGGITMRLDSTIRVNAELLPEGIAADVVVVIAKPPTVDVGNSSTGIALNQDTLTRVAVNPPGGKGGGARSLESLALLAPTAIVDQYGVSIAGTTSAENAFLIDGVSVADPAYGILGTPLSQEFIKEINIITGGYLPEYGKAMGGIIDVVTKSGSNEWHGQAYLNWTPGQLEGTRAAVTSITSSIVTRPYLGAVRDYGADVGGPIVKDKLWFYAGVNLAFTTDLLEQNYYRFNYMNDAAHPGTQTPVLVNGLPSTTPVTCSRLDAACPAHTPASPIFQANQQSIHYLGKLTYHINQDHNLTLSVYGTPSRSGGNGSFGFDQTGQPLQANPAQPGQIYGSVKTLAQQYINEAYDTSLKYSGAFDNKRKLLDVTLGWHHQHNATLALDGSGPGQTTDPTVMAGRHQVQYYQNSPAYNSVARFDNLPAGSCPTVPVFNPQSPSSPTMTPTCPAPTYWAGGPGFLHDAQVDSFQGKGVFTLLLQAAGHHVIKAGAEFFYNSYTNEKAYSGTGIYHDTAGGPPFYDSRQYGFITGPDTVNVLPHYTAHTTSTSLGGFLQDSWSILDKVTLNVGVRYDAQMIYGADGTLGLTLPNQWSPRVGVIYDFTQQGRSKLFANYARYYEGVPLDIADRSFPAEPTIYSFHNAPPCVDPLKNPASCAGTGGRIPVNSAGDPSQAWNRVGGGREAIDPNVQAQSSDEVVVGGEYELFADARFSLSYTHRWLVRALEDMSRDEANTYFLGNPGYGIASDFPQAVRTYDALTAQFTKTYSNTWLLTASYTLSRLYGNYAGLFRPETGQLDPNITSTFDLKSLFANQLGPLPGDHTHAIKIYGSKDFELPAHQDILVGLSYRGLSGGPISAFGAHPVYGVDESFVVPRGSGGYLTTTDLNSKSYGQITEARLPWIHTIDLKLGYVTKLSKASTFQVTMDVFNLFDFQAATQVDQRYTASPVQPCLSGTAPTCVVHSANGLGNFNPRTEVNANYGRPISYQDPRQFRFGARITF